MWLFRSKPAHSEGAPAGGSSALVETTQPEELRRFDTLPSPSGPPAQEFDNKAGASNRRARRAAPRPHD